MGRQGLLYEREQNRYHGGHDEVAGGGNAQPYKGDRQERFRRHFVNKRHNRQGLPQFGLRQTATKKKQLFYTKTWAKCRCFFILQKIYSLFIKDYN